MIMLFYMTSIIDNIKISDAEHALNHFIVLSKTHKVRTLLLSINMLLNKEI